MNYVVFRVVFASNLDDESYEMNVEHWLNQRQRDGLELVTAFKDGEHTVFVFHEQ